MVTLCFAALDAVSVMGGSVDVEGQMTGSWKLELAVNSGGAYTSDQLVLTLSWSPCSAEPLLWTLLAFSLRSFFFFNICFIDLFHLYRWKLDCSALDSVFGSKTFEFTEPGTKEGPQTGRWSLSSLISLVVGKETFAIIST